MIRVFFFNFQMIHGLEVIWDGGDGGGEGAKRLTVCKSFDVYMLTSFRELHVKCQYKLNLMNFLLFSSFAWIISVNFDHFQILRAIGKGSFGKVRPYFYFNRNVKSTWAIRKKNIAFTFRMDAGRGCFQRETWSSSMSLKTLITIPNHLNFISFWFHHLHFI